MLTTASNKVIGLCLVSCSNMLHVRCFYRCAICLTERERACVWVREIKFHICLHAHLFAGLCQCLYVYKFVCMAVIVETPVLMLHKGFCMIVMWSLYFCAMLKTVLFNHISASPNVHFFHSFKIYS